LFNGRNISENMLEFKRQFAYIPDNPDLYEQLTGIKYLTFIADVFKVDSSRNELIHKYASLFGI
jgi:ABC-2 type transport system ATP-binding protein